MGAAEDFVNPIMDCMDFAGVGLPIPDIAGPGGLPNFCLGLFLSQMAGINFVLDFIPPDPANLPSLPSLQIFIDAFLGGIDFPYYMPEFDLGGGFTIPEMPGLPDIDGTGAIKLCAIFIKLPFQCIELIIDKIISDLTVEIPGIPDIEALFLSLAASFGLAGLGIINLALCVATALFNLLTDMLL